MSNVHGFKQDVLLTNYARLLGPSLGSFVAGDPGVFPVADVPTKSGQYHDVQGGFFAASPGNRTILADGQEAPLTIEVAINKATGWEVETNGLGVKVSKHSEEYARGNGLNLEQAKVAVLTRANLIMRERIAAALAFSTTTFSGKTAALSGTDQWSDDASDPVDDAQTAKDNIIQASGEMPDRLFVGYQVHIKLRQHASILEYSSRTLQTGGLVSDATIAAALDVEQYRAFMSVANSAVEGQTASKAYLWGKFALFCKVRPSPAPMTPQSCLQRWRMQGSQDGAVGRWEPTPYVRQIDQLWNDQFAAPTTELGYLYSTVVA